MRGSASPKGEARRKCAAKPQRGAEGGLRVGVGGWFNQNLPTPVAFADAFTDADAAAAAAAAAGAGADAER